MRYKNIEYGYELADAVMEQYGIYNGAGKDRGLDAYAILIEQYHLTHDPWIADAAHYLEVKYGICEEDLENY